MKTTIAAIAALLIFMSSSLALADQTEDNTQELIVHEGRLNGNDHKIERNRINNIAVMRDAGSMINSNVKAIIRTRSDVNFVSSRTDMHEERLLDHDRILSNHGRTLNSHSLSIDDIYNKIDTMMDGVASSAALVPLMPSKPGKTTYNFSIATYGGSTAAGLTVVHLFEYNGHFYNLNAGVSSSGSETLGRLGFGGEI